MYSLSRWLKVKTKALQERLGPAEVLYGTQEVKAGIAERMTGRLQAYINETQAKLKQQIQPFIQKKRSLQHQHQNERSQLQHKQGNAGNRNLLIFLKNYQRGSRRFGFVSIKVHYQRKEIAKYMGMGVILPKAPQETTTPHQKHRDIDYTPEL